MGVQAKATGERGGDRTREEEDRAVGVDNRDEGEGDICAEGREEGEVEIALEESGGDGVAWGDNEGDMVGEGDWGVVGRGERLGDDEGEERSSWWLPKEHGGTAEEVVKEEGGKVKEVWPCRCFPFPLFSFFS